MNSTGYSEEERGAGPMMLQSKKILLVFEHIPNQTAQNVNNKRVKIEKRKT